jgi:intracellular sulfur oxidation DsrE/DsrF family protein
VRALTGLAAAVMLALAPLAGPAQQTTPVFGAPGPARYRVVMQVSNPEPRGWHQALNNALALRKNAGAANVQIEIVANGMGIGMLKYNSSESREVADVLEAGIKVLACGETMKALLLEKDDMLPGIGYVPGGLIEILDRQREGWQYIKAD